MAERKDETKSKGMRRYAAGVWRQLPPERAIALLADLFSEVWQRIPPDQRVDFLTKGAAEYLGKFLEGFDRQKRGELMNALLPVVAREFPLAELDFLTTFASPGDRYSPQSSEEDNE